MWHFSKSQKGSKKFPYFYGKAELKLIFFSVHQQQNVQTLRYPHLIFIHVWFHELFPKLEVEYFPKTKLEIQTRDFKKESAPMCKMLLPRLVGKMLRSVNKSSWGNFILTILDCCSLERKYVMLFSLNFAIIINSHCYYLLEGGASIKWSHRITISLVPAIM